MSHAAETSSAAEARGAFVRSRLGSLLAVAPLGIWTVAHLWNNLAAFDGPEAWQDAVTRYPHPIAQAATLVLVLLPLVLHTLWGVGRLFQARPNNVRYGYYANLKYALQRLSAVGLALFLGAHLWLALLRPRMMEGHAETFADISHEMRYHGPTLAVYVLGVLAVAYHLANGLHGFAMGWGVVSTRRSLKKLEGGVLVLFLLLLALGWAGVYALWRAGR
jgi:succinate dehydrogenase cytochrome b subunit